MPGKPLENPELTQEQEIALKKAAFLGFFRRWPVKSWAAESINRSSDTIDVWLKDDPEFSEAYLSARAAWADKKFSKVKPDTILMNMYPNELRPPKDGVSVNVSAGGEVTIYLPANGRDD